jgi:hypothetical protein
LPILMAMKIENTSSAKLPKNFEAFIAKLTDLPPREHLRGIDRLRLVDTIQDPRLRTQQTLDLPGLYHPRQGTQPAWLEIAVNSLLPQNKPFHKRALARLAFKNNLAALIFSLIGQHYYLTLRHSVKKGQLEGAVRLYTEKLLRKWGEQQHTLRARIFKPLQPTFERWAKSMQKQMKKEKKS